MIPAGQGAAQQRSLQPYMRFLPRANPSSFGWNAAFDWMRRDCLFVKSPTILHCVGEVDNPNAPSSVVEVDHSEILGLNNKHLANRVHVALTPVYAELLELGVVRLHGDPKGVDQLL